MIDISKSKVDWLHVDAEARQKILGLPGASFEQRGQILTHRSMLPLLDTQEAEDMRDRLARGEWAKGFLPKAWAARDLETAKLGFQLRTTQHSFLDYAASRRGVLCGDDMRLGKTTGALCAHDPARGQLVIVAPLSARGVWLGWARRVFPDLEIGVCVGKKFDKEVYDKPIVFCHYDVIASWLSLRPIGTLIFDEAHLLTNRKTGRAAGAVILQSRAEKVIALTGTPIWNMPPNMWMILGLVAPSAWGSYHEFSNRYGLPIETGYGTQYTGASHYDELTARLQEVMIRRLWKDCQRDLPAISRSVIVAEVSDTERRRLDILSAALREDRTSTASNLAAYRLQVTALKVGVAYKEATKILGRGEPVVLWTWHKEPTTKLKALLGDGAFVITGDISPDKRDAIIEQWKTSATPKVLIATMAVGQVAIDLSHARIAIFVEIDYTPAVLGQTEMRTFAPTRPMDLMFVVANHMTDQRIVRALINKLSAADSFGVGAANDAIDALRDAVMGPVDEGDLDRLLEDFLASA